MGAYLSTPITEKLSKNMTNEFLDVGVSSMQGWRISQEDSHNSILDFDLNTSYFAVYDGHGGAEVAVYCAQHLANFLKSMKSYQEGDYEQALKDAFLGFDATLLQEDVIEVLRQIAIEKNPDESEEDEGDEDEDLTQLRHEGVLPLHLLLEKYKEVTSKGNVQNQSTDKQGNEAVASSSKCIKAAPRCARGRLHCIDMDSDSAEEFRKALFADEKTSSDDDTIEISEETESSEKPVSKEKLSAESETNEVTSSIGNDELVINISSTSSDSSDSSDSYTGMPTLIPRGIRNNNLVKNEEYSSQTTSSDSTLEDTLRKGPFRAAALHSSSSENENTVTMSNITNGSGVQELPSSIGNNDDESDDEDDHEDAQEDNQDDTDEETDEDDNEGDNEDDDDDDDDDHVRNRVLDQAKYVDKDENKENVNNENKNKDDNKGGNDDNDDDTTSSDDDIDFHEEDFSSSTEEWEGVEDEGKKKCLLGDKNRKNMPVGPGKDSGCTAVVAMLHGKDLYVANVGDSRCVLCRKGKAIDMSIDHKPEDMREKRRIYAAGGRVSRDGRVNDGLNLSRAIGDHNYKMNEDLPPEKQMISAMPDVKKIVITPEDEFIILACDGIWNYMKSDEVVDFVKKRLDRGQTNLSKICEELFDYCIAPNTLGDGTGCDNMTALIVKFKQPDILKLPSKSSSSSSNEIKSLVISSKKRSLSCGDLPSTKRFKTDSLGESEIEMESSDKSAESSSGPSVENQNKEISTSGPSVENENKEMTSEPSVENENKEISTSGPSVENENKEISTSGPSVENENEEISTSGPSVENENKEISTSGSSVQNENEETSTSSSIPGIATSTTENDGKAP